MNIDKLYKQVIFNLNELDANKLLQEAEDQDMLFELDDFCNDLANVLNVKFENDLQEELDRQVKDRESKDK